MKKIFNYQNGKIKVTYNESPISKNYDEKYVAKEISHLTKISSNVFSLGIELMIHKGGRICYGMLNAQIQPSNEENIVKMSVGYTTENLFKYDSSILLDDEFVYQGLPEEYVGKIIDSVGQAVSQKEVYPQCEITFDYAANCEVGSSPMIFACISEMIVEIIYANSIEKIFDMNVKDFTNQYVKNIRFVY